MAASAPAQRRRSRARCSTTSSSARRPRAWCCRLPSRNSRKNGRATNGPRGAPLMALESSFTLRRVGTRLAEGIDQPLLLLLLTLSMLGFAALYSAANESPARVLNQLASLGVALSAMWIAAQIPPQTLMRLAVPAHLVGPAFLL